MTALGPLLVTSAGYPPPGGGPGTVGPQRGRTIREPALVPSSSSPMKPGTAKTAAFAASGDVQTKLVNNLQQQVFFLELELKYLREHGGAAPAGAKSAPAHADPAAKEQARGSRRTHRAGGAIR